jgi:branched-chain amino acid transport system substrate-binding protein
LGWRALNIMKGFGLTAIAAIAVAACAGGPASTGIRPSSAFPNADATNTAGAPTPTPAATAPQSQINARIALLVPLTAEGQTAQIAQGLKQAAELALFEFNNPGLQLIVKDTAGTAEGAAAAATSAVSAGAEIIVGPLFARSVRAVAPIARQAGLPVVAFSSDASVAGNGVYLLSFQPRQEVQRAVEFVARQGRTRFAALLPDNPYGEVLQAEFQSAVRASGGVVVDMQTYPPGASGMLQRAERLFKRVAGYRKDGSGELVPTGVATADAVFVPGDGATLPSLGPVMANAGIDPSQIKVFGDGGWDFPNVGRTQALVGGIFAAPDPRGFQNFTTKYARAFNAAPPRIATFAFDGVSLAAALANRAPRGQRFGATQLTQASGFTGVDGPVRFLASGLSERALAILEVSPNGPVIADPAPQRFDIPRQTASTRAPPTFFSRDR